MVVGEVWNEQVKYVLHVFKVESSDSKLQEVSNYDILILTRGSVNYRQVINVRNCITCTGLWSKYSGSFTKDTKCVHSVVHLPFFQFFIHHFTQNGR